jgi:IS5 family transposase
MLQPRADAYKEAIEEYQRDRDAGWTKKHGESFYGYKNHIGVDRSHKIIHKWAATDAWPHDRQMLADILERASVLRCVK